MGISSHPSTVTLPQIDKPYPSILEFLDTRFEHIPREIWEERITTGKVLDAAGAPITLTSSYLPLMRLLYFREVESEPHIPFTETILHQDDELLVACKPHFLPVTPGGRYVEECLLNRLRSRTGIQDLVPLHRIDRETAGIVLFSVNKQTRGRYGRLFLDKGVEKTYLARSSCLPVLETAEWVVENRIERGKAHFRMQIVPGKSNARSAIRLLECKEGMASFQLQPLTGKTHQLRIHMSDLGFGILNDRFYPELQPESADNFSAPLQLLAKTVKFRDPLSGKLQEFTSEQKLLQ